MVFGPVFLGLYPNTNERKIRERFGVGFRRVVGVVFL